VPNEVVTVAVLTDLYACLMLCENATALSVTGLSSHLAFNRMQLETIKANDLLNNAGDLHNQGNISD
jgi:hypothetical protein